MKKLISLIVSIVIIISIFVATPIVSHANTTIQIGDYVQMGRYYDEPILWRCVDIDENGPLMLSDKIITMKSFDVRGIHKYIDATIQADNGGKRQFSGSNLWETSNIRSWLNSSSPVGNVRWLDDCPPFLSETSQGIESYYANEKGFLAEGNFSSSEINAIKSVSQKSLLNILDVTKLNEGGTAIHTANTYIETVVQNYDTAYYQNVIDKMFLLDVKQLNKIYQNSALLGENYYRAKPTQKAIDNTEFKFDILSISNDWLYWTRSPNTNLDYPQSVRSVHLEGNALIDDMSAEFGYIGVRPAFYLDESATAFQSGNGSIEMPYNGDTMHPTAHRIIYNANNSTGGTIPVDNQGYIRGSVITVAGNDGNLVKEGSKFVGWNTKPNGSGEFYTTGKFVMGDEDITLYAIFSVVKIGDYVKLGSYFYDPILWRCVDIDENGPLMLSDKILTIKSLDVPQNIGTLQENYNNLWEISNLRIWLNSNEAEGNVKWMNGFPPAEQFPYDYFQSYADESGFLSEHNFTKKDLNVIKSVTQKTLLSDIDAPTMNVDGTAKHRLDMGVATVVQNYDTAYYQNVTDKMFILDVKQLNKVYQNGEMLGTDYCYATPTQKAIDHLNSPYGTRYFWLRTPYTNDDYPHAFRCVTDNDIDNNIGMCPVIGGIGVRPAFYLNQSAIGFQYGDGSVEAPYGHYSESETLDYKGSPIEQEMFPTFMDTTYDLKAKYQNNTNETQSGLFVVTVKKNNQLISVYTMENTFAPSEEYTFNQIIDIPASIVEDKVEVEFYIWNGFNSMKSKQSKVKNVLKFY